jgi:thiol-disulfide isomerase/thioredoxin
MKFYLLFGAVVATLLMAGGCSPNTSVEAKLQSLDDVSKAVILNDFKGKVVLIDFWATWCGPCRMVRPQVVQLYAKYKDRGLVVLSVTGEDRKTVEGFEKTQSAKLPVYLDGESNFARSFQVTAIPTLVVIDKNGKEVHRQEGAADNLNEVESVIEQALGDSR